MIERALPQVAPETSPRAVNNSSRQAGDDFLRWLSDSSEQSHVAETANSVEQAVSKGEEALLHVELLGSQGQRELLSIPWQLAGSNRLSHETHGKAAELQATISAVPMDPMAERARSSPSAVPFIYGRGGYSARDIGGMSGYATQGPAPHMVANAAREVGRTQLATAAVPWLERLVRLLERSGQDPTVWVRDYRLDDVQAQALVELLKERSREHGVRLERVVINGHEVWRSASAPNGTTENL